ncbi:MAG: hypothetical protein JWQ04_2390 [Pedosphaera sp.]|nr:hypothetical protein [Pedosphaera sp.]
MDSALSSPFRGESSCSSSGCHGGAGEKHNQCLRWSKFDVHTRSYATLTLARSARLADILKLGDPVQSARCTVCHAPFQSLATNAVLRKALDPAAGVSCENCHGPAEKWLLSHTRTDFTHQDRVNAGLRDLSNPYVRANSCVACHQNVDADVLQAGHPELIFELDGQTVSEPKHWREGEKWSGAQTWFVGQAVAFREMSWQLKRENSPPENAARRWSALSWLLQIARQAAPGLPAVIPGMDRYARAQDWGDELARDAGLSSWPADATRKCLDLLAATAADFRDAATPGDIQARRAERLVLALDRLVAGLNDDATAKRLDAPLGKLFKDAQSLPDFDPKKFADDLEMFQKALNATP